MSKNEEKNLYIEGWILPVLFWLIHAGIKYFSLEPPFAHLPCVLRELTGIYCPGCGGTRAFRALLDGQILKSFFYHPVVPYAAAVYAWFMISHTIEYLSKGRIAIGMKPDDKYLYFALLIILVQWILKNCLKFIWGIELL